MKKFTLSLVTVLAMSTFAIAGGDIAPVEPIVEAPMVEESIGAFYVGLAYGAANIDTTETYIVGEPWSDDFDYSTVMLQAGYKFNPYIAVEGRYWIGLDEDVYMDETINIDTWGIYVKPIYPVTDAIDIYGLLGYASSNFEWTGYPDHDLDGFSWGIGGAYDFSDNVAVFVDYTSMYNDDTADIDTIYDNEITSWNFGVTYTF